MNWIKAGVALVTATVGAVLYFAPMDMVKANADQIAMLDLKGELNYYEEREWEIRKQCMNLKTEEWLCSDSVYKEYLYVVRQIEITRIELGLDPQPEGGP